ncbi:MAG: HDOD domain-containing protein [Pirellulales bacterium]
MSPLQVDAVESKPSLEKVVAKVDQISTLPHVAIRLLEVASDANAGAADLKEVLESDASLSARVLRCVNSSAFALRSEITNLLQAIAYLGFKQVRNFAMTASVSEIFKQNDSIGPYRRSELWRHLVSVGICARLIAMRRKLATYEDAFLAGLMHDIGIILEDQFVHEDFSRMMQSLPADKQLAETEREHFQFDHTTLGERVSEIWKFPEVLKAAIRYHHASVAYRGPFLPILQCVELANLLCTLKNIPSVGLKLVRFHESTLTALSLTKEDLKVLAADLDQEILLHKSLFIM